MLREFYKDINFDPSREIWTVYKVTQGDTKSRGLIVTFILGDIVTPAGLHTMKFFAVKPDKTTVLANATIDGDKFIVDFTNQVLAVPGVVVCSLVLYGTDGDKIADKKFKLIVESSLEDGAVISVNERGILDRAFELAEDIVPRLELLDLIVLEGIATEYATLKPELMQAKTDVITATGQAIAATGLANTATNDAITATSQAVDKIGEMTTKITDVTNLESATATAEGLRVTAETGRVSAETGRANAETTRAGFYAGYNTSLGLKADKVTTYTKTENDTAMALKADKSTTYTKTEVDTKDALKADKIRATNLITNGDFSQGVTGWTAGNVAFSVANNEALVLASTAGGHLRQLLTAVKDRKYYVRAKIKSTSNQVAMVVINSSPPYNNPFPPLYHSGSGLYEDKSGVYTMPDAVTTYNLRFVDYRLANFDNVNVKNILLIDLTSTFGAGNEPTKEQMDDLLLKYPNSWFDGTVDLVSVNDLMNQKASKVQEAWITPTLLNGATGTIQYRKNQFGRIEFKGYLSYVSDGAKPFMSLPSGYYQPTTLRLPIYTLDNIAGNVYIASGVFILPTALSGKTVDLSHLSYTV